MKILNCHWNQITIEFDAKSFQNIYLILRYITKLIRYLLIFRTYTSYIINNNK